MTASVAPISIASRTDRTASPHQLGLIVHRLEVHAGRQRGRDGFHDPGYTVGEAQVCCRRPAASR